MAQTVTTSIVSLNNYLFESGIRFFADSTLSGFSPANVGNPNRSKKWRAGNYQGNITFDLIEKRHPEVIGLIECNFGTKSIWDFTATITLTGSDDYYGLRNAIQWQWTDQMNSSNRTWVKPLGDYLTGTYSDDVERRWWKIDISISIPSASTNYIFVQPEIGVAWLGSMIQAPLDTNFTIKMMNPGKESESYSGSIFTEVMRPYSEVSVTMPIVDDDSALLIKEKFDSSAGRPVLIDIYAPNTTTGKSIGTYYGVLDENNTMGFNYKTNRYVDIKFKLTESLS